MKKLALWHTNFFTRSAIHKAKHGDVGRLISTYDILDYNQYKEICKKYKVEAITIEHFNRYMAEPILPETLPSHDEIDNILAEFDNLAEEATNY